MARAMSTRPEFKRDLRVILYRPNPLQLQLLAVSVRGQKTLIVTRLVDQHVAQKTAVRIVQTL